MNSDTLHIVGTLGFEVDILYSVWLNCRYMNSLGNKKVELFDMGAGVSEPTADENVQVASCKILIINFQFLLCFLS